MTKKRTKKSPKPAEAYKPRSAGEQILANLANDPNVLPLLQNVVEHIFRTRLNMSPPELPAIDPPAEERPTKRRKLTKLPAGAESWTQPFPFREGEGPAHYRETWQMRRLTILLDALLKGLRKIKRNEVQMVVEEPIRRKVIRSKSSRTNQLGSTTLSPQPQIVPNVELDQPLSDETSPNVDLAVDRLMELLKTYQGNCTPLSQSSTVSTNPPLSPLIPDDSIISWDQWLTSSNPLPPPLDTTSNSSSDPTGTFTTPDISFATFEEDVQMASDNNDLALSVPPDSILNVLSLEIPEVDVDTLNFVSELGILPTSSSSLTRPQGVDISFLDELGTIFASDLPSISTLDGSPNSLPSIESTIEPPHKSLPLSLQPSGIPASEDGTSCLPNPATLQNLSPDLILPTLNHKYMNVPGTKPITPETVIQRAQVLAQAKELRAQLLQEYEAAKLVRWETLMEHSVLSAIVTKNGKATAAMRHTL